jgi:DsbC/DsbD-like thiol-disulfide interchange protein
LIAETLEIFSPGHEMGGEIVDDMVSARAWLDSPTYYPFQRLHLVAELAIAPGFHVYRRTISEGYVPLGIEVAVISGMDVKSGRWPSPRPYRVDGLDEQFLVHEGTICGLYPLVFTAPPWAGDHVIKAIVRYQVCSVSTGWPPATIPVDLPVKEVALVGRSFPPAWS